MGHAFLRGNDAGRPDGSEAVSAVEALTRSYANDAWQITHTDEYFNLSGLTYTTDPSLGVENTHFYRTQFAYDDRGRPHKTTAPTGTITKTDYDDLGRPIAVSVGTSDVNMVQVTTYEYDGGGVGDGNLTSMTQHPGGGAADRQTDYFYDWRNRLVATKAGVEAIEDDVVNRPIVYMDYDNLNQVIAVEQYDGDGVTIDDLDADGVPDKPDSMLLRAYSTTDFDVQGRVYRTSTFSVDPEFGDISIDALTTDFWYDHRGQVVKVASPGGLVTKHDYDGAGRQTVSYLSDGGGDISWSNGLDVTADTVLEQVENTYDAAGNIIQVTTRQRFHDETATGALGDPTTAPKARVSYTGMYYDLANRLTDTVNVGTNGGSAWTRPSSPPARSDTALVTSYDYNAAGWRETTTDPRGINSKRFYDNLGRVTKTIAAYTDGIPTDDSNYTTEFTYDGSHHTLTVKAVLPNNEHQTTQFVYGVTTASGSDVNSNDMLAAMKYPDKTTGDPSDLEKETYTVNALGQTKTATDRNGNVHSYSFDVIGRLTADAVTTLGSGVDGAVRRMEVAYDGQGNPFLFTNYHAATGGNIVNEVQREYNGLGQLIAEYQEHTGAVETGVSPVVEYAYSEMTGGANHSRLESMTYPDGRVLEYNYSTGLDDSISRLTSLFENSTTLESFDYLGVSTVVRRAHPEPDVDLTYIKQSMESNGDAGDQYTGLDRFGRVVDQRWIDTTSGSHTDRFQYGYDRNSNRAYRENLIDEVFSELYAYDDFNQLTSFDRGELNGTKDGIVGTPSRSQDWDLDALGNWDSLTNDGGSPETRTHNLQNQVTQVGSANLTFDNNGNLTTDENGNELIYDAWNRLVEVLNSSEVTIAEYAYDALNRRITETADNTTVDLFYSAAWQVLEEQVSGETTTQYTWSPVYVDAMILRDRDTDDNGTLDERLYVQQDANFNVTALIDTSGDVVERYMYDPYGAVTIYNADWSSTKSSSDYEWMHLHQGGRFDADTGVYHFRNREYSPTLGRWVQNDPTGFAAGDIDLYRAFNNSPINWTDSNGLQSMGLNQVLTPPEIETAQLVDRLMQNPQNNLYFSSYQLELWRRWVNQGRPGAGPANPNPFDPLMLPPPIGDGSIWAGAWGGNCGGVTGAMGILVMNPNLARAILILSRARLLLAVVASGLAALLASELIASWIGANLKICILDHQTAHFCWYRCSDGTMHRELRDIAGADCPNIIILAG